MPIYWPADNLLHRFSEGLWRRCLSRRNEGAECRTGQQTDPFDFVHFGAFMIEQYSLSPLARASSTAPRSCQLRRVGATPPFRKIAGRSPLTHREVLEAELQSRRFRPDAKIAPLRV